MNKMIGSESAPSVLWWGCLFVLFCGMGQYMLQDPDTEPVGYCCLCCGLAFGYTFAMAYGRGVQDHGKDAYFESLKATS